MTIIEKASTGIDLQLSSRSSTNQTHPTPHTPHPQQRCNNIIIARDHAEGTEGGHKNSTVWPSLARRLTKNKGNSNGLSTHHPSNWLGDVTLDKSQCDQIKAAFKKLNIGMSELPGDCK